LVHNNDRCCIRVIRNVKIPTLRNRYTESPKQIWSCHGDMGLGIVSIRRISLTLDLEPGGPISPPRWQNIRQGYSFRAGDGGKALAQISEERKAGLTRREVRFEEPDSRGEDVVGSKVELLVAEIRDALGREAGSCQQST
jgi:hypothetical protein